MWHKVVGWVQMAYGDLPQVMEDNSYSRACNPDEIVIAAVLQSFAKHVDDWEMCRRDHNYHRQRTSDPQFIYIKVSTKVSNKRAIYFTNGDAIYLRNKKKDVTVRIKSVPFAGSYKIGEITVNQVPVDVKYYPLICKHWEDSQGKLERLKETARKAKLEMELNEKKWNLAERLLNMKRNEHGALIPIIDVRKIEEPKTTMPKGKFDHETLEMTYVSKTKNR